jgi:hypothetical protein
MVGTELRLKIHEAADVLINERRMKILQYWAGPEDGVCRRKSNFDFGFLVVNKIVTVACYGEVWTDENTNILRTSEHYELPGKCKDYQAVVTYGWLQRAKRNSSAYPRHHLHAGGVQQKALLVSWPLYRLQGIQQSSESRGELIGSMRSSATSAPGRLHVSPTPVDPCN